LPNSYCCEGEKEKKKRKPSEHLVSWFGYRTSNKDWPAAETVEKTTESGQRSRKRDLRREDIICFLHPVTRRNERMLQQGICSR